MGRLKPLGTVIAGGCRFLISSATGRTRLQPPVAKGYLKTENGRLNTFR
jgi:hypothetical protein